MNRPRKILLALVGAAAACVLAVPVLVPLVVDVDGLRPSLEARLQAALGRRVALGAMRLSLWSGLGLRVESVRIGEPLEGAVSGAPVVEAGPTAIRVALRPLLRGEVEVRSIAIAALRVTQDGRPLVSGVRVSSRLRIAPGRVVEIAALKAAVGPVRITASGRVTELGAEAPRIALAGSARLNRSMVNGRVEVVAGSQRPTASFDLASPLLDADEIVGAVLGTGQARSAPRASMSWLVPEAHAEEPGRSAGQPAFARALEATGALRADRCVARGLEMTGLSMRVSLADGMAEFRDISLALYGGTAKGSLTLRPFAPTLPFTVDQTAGGVSIGPLIEALAPAQAGTVEGKASLSVRLRGDAGGAALLPSMTGAGDVSIVDGKIASVGVIKQVMKALATAGATGIERDETPFDHLSAHFDLAQAAASTKDLVFRSPDLDGDGAGTVGLGGALKLDVLASFSKRVSDALVAKTHALSVRLGTDGRLSVPLLVRGTIQEPRIQLDLERVLSEGVLKQLKKEGTKSLLKNLLGR